MSDFITLVTTAEPCNKRVFFKGDCLTKKAGLAISEAVAVTIPVATVADMVLVQQAIADDPCKVIIGGYIPGTEGNEPYNLWRSVWRSMPGPERLPKQKALTWARVGWRLMASAPSRG